MKSLLSKTDEDRDPLSTLIGRNSGYYLQQFDRLAQNKRSFNWCAFLLPVFVLLYRKQYAYFIKFVFPVSVLPFLYIILNGYSASDRLNMTLYNIAEGFGVLWLICVPIAGILCGTGFNKHYKKQLESIIRTHQIKMSDEDTIKRYQPSTLIPAVFVILYSILLMVTSAVVSG